MLSLTKSQHIIDLINWGTKNLLKNNVKNARRESEWMVYEVINSNPLQLHLEYSNIIDEKNCSIYKNMIRRRGSGEPFQHILGKATYYGRDYKVNKNVLIPRPETELLIEIIKGNGGAKRLIDIGTGSGCIAITCRLEQLASEIYATDVCNNALNVARENMALHDVNSITMFQHNILLNNFDKKYDLLVSNPPYVSSQELLYLNKDVRDYDPKIALSDNNDGLDFYRCFAEKFNDIINDGGYMILEIGGNKHKKHVEKIFNNYGFNIKCFKDLQGDFRVIELRK